MRIELTDQSKKLIKKKLINGDEYWLCDYDEEKELWVKAPSLPVIPVCPLCGYTGYSMDKHHIDGRKNSDRIIEICANCHREVHSGKRTIQ